MTSHESTAPVSHSQAHVPADDHSHPGPAQYILVALILAVITGIEVWVYYIEALRSAIVPILLSLSVVKFVMVVAWFMHLKFDSRLFRRFFVLGLVLALTMYAVVLVTILKAL